MSRCRLWHRLCKMPRRNDFNDYQVGKRHNQLRSNQPHQSKILAKAQL